MKWFTSRRGKVACVCCAGGGCFVLFLFCDASSQGCIQQFLKLLPVIIREVDMHCYRATEGKVL